MRFNPKFLAIITTLLYSLDVIWKIIPSHRIVTPENPSEPKNEQTRPLNLFLRHLPITHPGNRFHFPAFP